MSVQLVSYFTLELANSMNAWQCMCAYAKLPGITKSQPNRTNAPWADVVDGTDGVDVVDDAVEAKLGNEADAAEEA